MNITVIPSDKTVIVDGVLCQARTPDEWTFNDHEIHAIQWEYITGTVEYERTTGLGTDEILDYDATVAPYVNWHTVTLANHASLDSSLADIDTRFYVIGPIDYDTYTYTKTERDLDECKTEQSNVVIDEANNKLKDTDWWYVRNAELDAGGVPSEIDEYRAEVRTTRDDRLNLINSAVSVPGLEQVVNAFDEYTVTAQGVVNFATRTFGYGNVPVNGTEPWPRIDYKKLTER